MSKISDDVVIPEAIRDKIQQNEDLANLVEGMEQMDPRLIKHIKEQRLIPPSEEPYGLQMPESSEMGPGQIVQQLFKDVSILDNKLGYAKIGCMA